MGEAALMAEVAEAAAKAREMSQWKTRQQADSDCSVLPQQGSTTP